MGCQHLDRQEVKVVARRFRDALARGEAPLVWGAPRRGALTDSLVRPLSR